MLRVQSTQASAAIAVHKHCKKGSRSHRRGVRDFAFPRRASPRPPLPCELLDAPVKRRVAGPPGEMDQEQALGWSAIVAAAHWLSLTDAIASPAPTRYDQGDAQGINIFNVYYVLRWIFDHLIQTNQASTLAGSPENLNFLENQIRVCNMLHRC